MAEQEKQPLTASDSTVSGSTQTGRAVALARLLHQECIQLLELFWHYSSSIGPSLFGALSRFPFGAHHTNMSTPNALSSQSYHKERETSLSDQTPDGGRMVSLSPEATESTTEEQVQLLHSALRQCLGMIHCVIQKEEEEWGRLEDNYETLKASVRARLENLLHTTKNLLRSKDKILDVTPDHQCNEDVDGIGGTFGLKMWTYRVLLELIHWADQAAKTLHVLHEEREGTK
ncbi:uncharacterized protein LOC114158022 isoform X1 [Xiphophorus couchianus]|uniref:uncharacterized protein LOC114158022 isoform X1 n=1 Tax=Xiphophorus couchianus TaxID=32473 RepID=UPI001016C915|nr:uncharacterized protein LOC114158022 isoform X1 [Xiphophorus couchianus]